MQIKPIDIQRQMLFYLHPCILLVLFVSLIATLMPFSYRQENKTAYVLLLSLLFVLLFGAGFLLKRNHYLFSVILTVLIPLTGSWVSTYINFRGGIYELLPLCYGVIPIMLASFFLPIITAVVLMGIQLIAFGVVITTTPLLHIQNWPSFSIFVFFVCLISIIANTLINKQLQQLKKLAIRDYLTNLFNRRYFEETLAIKLNRILPETRNLGLILFDIDHFKVINDTYGHDAGDTTLTTLAALLVEFFDLSCTICRYGGDEFTILVPQVTRSQLATITQNLVERVNSCPIIHKEKKIGFISISAGYVLADRNGITVSELLECVDKALYRAKQSGRNRAMGNEELYQHS